MRVFFLQQHYSAIFFGSGGQNYGIKLFYVNRTDKPNTDLLSHWGLPKLDSVLNIHMLPIASTVAKRLTLIGFDGKSPTSYDNEDFWGHSATAQYHEFVDTGHAMHLLLTF